MSTITIEQTLSELLPRPAVEEIVTRYGDGYSALFKAEEYEWRTSTGMGQRGIEKLRAIKALVREVQTKKQNNLINATSAKSVYEAMSDMQFFEQEHVRVLYLNGRNHVIKFEDISTGTLNMAPMDSKCVFSTAVRLKASAVILVHNHPTGDPTPSETDIASTRSLMAAGHIIGIPVLDHIVIGAGSYTSMNEEGLL